MESQPHYTTKDHLDRNIPSRRIVSSPPLSPNPTLLPHTPPLPLNQTKTPPPLTPLPHHQHLRRRHRPRLGHPQYRPNRRDLVLRPPPHLVRRRDLNRHHLRLPPDPTTPDPSLPRPTLPLQQPLLPQIPKQRQHVQLLQQRQPSLRARSRLRGRGAGAWETAVGGGEEGVDAFRKRQWFGG